MSGRSEMLEADQLLYRERAGAGSKQGRESVSERATYHARRDKVLDS